MDFGLKAFQASETGHRVGLVLADDDVIRDMIAFSRHGLPAVRVIGKRLLGLGIQRDDGETKKLVGRWVGQLLESHGWVPVGTSRLPRGNLFSTGAIYGQQ